MKWHNVILAFALILAVVFGTLYFSRPRVITEIEYPLINVSPVAPDTTWKTTLANLRKQNVKLGRELESLIIITNEIFSGDTINETAILNDSMEIHISETTSMEKLLCGELVSTVKAYSYASVFAVIDSHAVKYDFSQHDAELLFKNKPKLKDKIVMVGKLGLAFYLGYEANKIINK